MNGTPSICVIGSGYWGKNLIRNFHALGVLKLICDKDEASLERFREQYPDVETSLALSDVLARQDIAGVVISTPAETHYPIARECLLAGKHLLVEKPLTLDESEAEELIGLAEKKGVTLMVGHLLQYHPVFVKLKQLAHDGELGRIHYIYSHRLNLGKIRREENIFWSFAPHDISMLLSLAGEMPETVSTTGGNYLHEKIADVTVTHMNFSSGLKAHIFVSWLHPFKEQKFVVVGDRKMAVFDDTLPWEDKLLLYPHQIRWEGNLPVPDKAEAERVAIPQSEPLKSECAHFLECMAEGRFPITDGDEGLRVLKVLKRGQESLDDGGCEKSVESGGEERAFVGKNYFVHETAIIDPGASVGKESKIWHFSHIMGGTTLGQACKIGQNVVIGPDVTVGDRCKIQNNVSVYKGVTLEDEVFCGPSMVFTNVYNPRAHIARMHEIRETLVRKGATLGANCTVVCGNTIGRYAFVGAGAVVTKDVPDHAMVMGNPAFQAGWVCECGNKLDDDLTCPVCSARYGQAESGLRKV